MVQVARFADDVSARSDTGFLLRVPGGRLHFLLRAHVRGEFSRATLAGL